jgi:uncharacterized protein YutE (UPF0331/DUF86 family)
MDKCEPSLYQHNDLNEPIKPIQQIQRAPKDYADSFSVLNETKFIPLELCKKLRQMAKFRNRLVHPYGEIDDKYIYEFIRSDLKDFNEYKKSIVKLLKDETRQKDR